MLTPCRLYIASPDWREMERALTADARFSIIGSGAEGEAALRNVTRLCPDLLILDSVLTGMDGRAALKRIARMATPPRVLFLLRGKAMDAPRMVDAVCPYPQTKAEEWIKLAAETAARPLPALTEPWAEERERIADTLLDRLQTPASLKGRAYLRCAAAALACAPSLGESFAGYMYPYVASRYGATPSAVERAIRTAIEHTWLLGSLTEIQALFGLSVDADRGKPTNAECVAMLAEHVRRQIQRQIDRQEGMGRP
ncbi:MAG: hypothetical protein IJ662_05955 [Clostridia bacterium]|nr:hypothetical protein [Clostridia bacterium]